MNRSLKCLREPSLITSIPPKAISAYSTDSRARDFCLALSSFRANGFNVTSINTAAEIDDLRKFFPNTTFAALDAFTGMFADRYGPSLGAIFNVSKSTDFCAIVNADIYMLSSAITETFAKNPKKFYVARRLDIERYGGKLRGTYRHGIDAVFFDPSQFSALLDDAGLQRFQLGAPFWDIISPIIASFHGEVSFIDPPFILHVVHPTNWSVADYSLLKDAAVTTVVGHAKKYKAVSESAAKFLDLMEKHGGVLNQDSSKRQMRRAVRVLNYWLEAMEMWQRQEIRVDLNDENFYPSVISHIQLLDATATIQGGDSLPGGFIRQAYRRRRLRRHQVEFEKFVEEMAP